MTNKPKTSIILLMYNHLDTTKKCFHYVKKYTNLEDVELIAVNNGSSDGTKEWVESQPEFQQRIHLEKNVGLTKGYNIGIKAANGEEIFLLANDILVTKNWLPNFRKCLYHDEKVGIISPIMNIAAYQQSIHVPYDTLEEMEEYAASFNKSDPKKWQYRTMLVTCCAFAKKEVLENIGYFDERYPASGSYSDVDLTLTATAKGYRNYVCLDTFVHHYGSQTISEGLKENLAVGKRLFQEKNHFCGDDDSGANLLATNIHRFVRNPHASFVEIGTGFGMASSIMQHYFPKLYYQGYDTVRPAVDIAKQFLDIQYVPTFTHIPMSKKYDFVFLNRILKDKKIKKREVEYVTKLVKKGGVLLGNFENKKFFSNTSSSATNLFTYDEIEEFLQKNRFRSYWIHPIEAELTKEQKQEVILFYSKKSQKKEIDFVSSFIVLAVK